MKAEIITEFNIGDEVFKMTHTPSGMKPKKYIVRSILVSFMKGSRNDVITTAYRLKTIPSKKYPYGHFLSECFNGTKLYRNKESCIKGELESKIKVIFHE